MPTFIRQKSVRYTPARAVRVSEPSKLRVFLSILWVKIVFTPGVWFYKLFTGSKMYLMKSDPREKDIISTKQPGYIHGGEKYAPKDSEKQCISLPQYSQAQLWLCLRS